MDSGLQFTMNENDLVTCIHPVLETRGMIQDDGDKKYQITLKDCLACSGCAITEDEITLLAKQNPEIILNSLSDIKGFVVLVSTAAISNLAAVREWTPAQAFGAIHNYFMKKGALKVETDTVAQLVWRQIILREFLSYSGPKPYIISRCAGSNVFIERKTPIGVNLAQVLPFPQLFALYEKKIINSTNYVLNIGPCYDRKLETTRFPGLIDSVLTIGEIVEFLEPSEPIDVSFPPENDILYILKQLSPDSQVLNKTRRGITEYKVDRLVGGLICGSSASEQFAKMVTKGECPFDIVETDFCPLACESGGGLIRGESASKRKIIVEKTKSIHSSFTQISHLTNEIQKMYDLLNQIEIKAEYASVPEAINKKELVFDW